MRKSNANFCRHWNQTSWLWHWPRWSRLNRKRALRHQWQLRVERAQYGAERARRQYHAVEPENRLVARNLGHRWEEQLPAAKELDQARQRWAARSEHVIGCVFRHIGPRRHSGAGRGFAGSLARPDHDRVRSQKVDCIQYRCDGLLHHLAFQRRNPQRTQPTVRLGDEDSPGRLCTVCSGMNLAVQFVYPEDSSAFPSATPLPSTNSAGNTL